jgi:serine protease Do
MHFASEDAVISAVEKIAPSVVNISTLQLMVDILLHAHPVRGSGSGTVISQQHVMTNAHVLEGAQEIEAKTADGKKLKGRVLGVDHENDIAIIEIKGTKLKPVELGDSDKLKVGQSVLAFGNPFGLPGGPTLTTGVVSALSRGIRTETGKVMSLIQTDAAINPGNSGGPLADLEGRVIAINTAIIPYAQGIGFAIPINSARKVAERIIGHRL